MMNQCDGCKQHAPIKISTFGSKLHLDKNGKAFMACEAYRYQDELIKDTDGLVGLSSIDRTGTSSVYTCKNDESTDL